MVLDPVSWNAGVALLVRGSLFQPPGVRFLFRDSMLRIPCLGFLVLDL